MGDSSPTSHSTLCVTPVVCGSCADGIGRHTERRISAPRAYDIILGDNNLSGSLDLGEVPGELNALDISKNKFSGSLNLGKITTSEIRHLRIKHNNFEGNLDLSALPKDCIEFDASHNEFSGDILLEGIPATLHSLDLSHNHFTGVPDLSDIPDCISDRLCKIMANDNCLEGNIQLNLQSTPGLVVSLGNNPGLHGTAKGRQLSIEQTHIVRLE